MLTSNWILSGCDPACPILLSLMLFWPFMKTFTKQYARSFVHLISFNPHSHALRKILLSPFYKGRSRNSDSSKVAQLTNGRNWVQPYTLSAPSHCVPALPPALKLQIGFSLSARWKLEMRACGEGWATGLLCRGLKPFGLLPTNSFPFLSCWWKAWYYRWLCFICTHTHTHTHTHSKESAHCI